MNEVASLHRYIGHVDQRVEPRCRRARSARAKQSQIRKLPRSYDIADVKTKARSAFLAGDTTALYLSATIYHILKDASIYRESSRRDGKSHRGRQNRLHPRHIQSGLTVASPCMEETARVHPAALPIPRNAPPQGCNDRDMDPDGTKVGVNSYVTACNDVLGEEPETFIPARWTRVQTSEADAFLQASTSTPPSQATEL